jgi:hypothetical protein
LIKDLGCDQSCESMYAHASSVHQKCSSYAQTNLLFGLCKSMWIIDLIVIHPSPHPGGPRCPSTLKVLRIKERTQFFLLLLFSPWTRSWVYQRILGCVFSNPLLDSKLLLVRIFLHLQIRSLCEGYNVVPSTWSFNFFVCIGRVTTMPSLATCLPL